MKAQPIRLIDVFLLGPFMIWTGLKSESRLTRAIMVASGIATIGYNGRNYLLIREKINVEKASS